MRHGRSSPRAGVRGAALLLAMIIVALVATAAAGMVWQQNRAVTIEAAQRAREDAAWILTGALDWARLILREDQRANRQRNATYDALDEPWAQPLAEARLSSFLAADKDNNADSGPEAFISGAIEDAQSRFNVRGLVDAAGKPVVLQVEALRRVCAAAGVSSDTADRIAQALADAQAGAANPGTDAPIRPQSLADLAWQGLDPAQLAQLQPYVDLLPVPTPLNLNTASREALVAGIENLDLGGAQRLVQARQRKHFTSLLDVQALLAPGTALDPARTSVSTAYFYVSGRLRLEDRVLEERSLLVRRNAVVDVLRREKRSFLAPSR
jgi:general secretion pathway protein K